MARQVIAHDKDAIVKNFDKALKDAEKKDGGKWHPFEIVDGKAVETKQEPSDAIQAAADTPQPPEPEEVIAATPAVTVTIRVEPLCVDRIEQARALLGLAYGEPAELVPEGIQSFKDTDGRTMRVVVVDGALFKQEVIR
jgi:hypothetical protein